mmetsp:Transcript_20526/g.42570  ORF Transcript_20526/g.42570 Transcript_20526/m.42570 type:complete len:376 (+) Transcript_20526:40-1167(+)
MGQAEAREGDHAAGEALPAVQITGKSCASTCSPHVAAKASQSPDPLISATAVVESDRVEDSRLAKDCIQLDVAVRRPSKCSNGSFRSDVSSGGAGAVAVTCAGGDAEGEHCSAFQDVGSPCHGQATATCMPRALTTLASAAAGVVTSAAALPKRSDKVSLGHDGSRSQMSSPAKVARQSLRPASARTSVVKVVATAARAKKRSEVPVALHVYDASWLAPADSSIPIVHLGVEVYGSEFFFGTSGVLSSGPGAYDPERHRHRLLLGHTKLPKREVYRMLMSLKKDWPGTGYRLIGRNCQTFALTLCECLGLGSRIPEQYIYFAKPWTLGSSVDLNKMIPLTLSGQLGSDLRSCGSVRGKPDKLAGTKLNVEDTMYI